MSPFHHGADKQVAAFEEARRDRMRQGVPRASLAGDLALIEPGWEIWAQRRRWADDDEADTRGGLVVEILAGPVDTETGEVGPPRYRCYDPTRPLDHAWTLLTPAEVDPERTWAGVHYDACQTAVRRLLRPVAEGRHRWLTATDRQLLDDAITLYRAVRLQ